MGLLDCARGLLPAVTATMAAERREAARDPGVAAAFEVFPEATVVSAEDMEAHAARERAAWQQRHDFSPRARLYWTRRYGQRPPPPAVPPDFDALVPGRAWAERGAALVAWQARRDALRTRTDTRVPPGTPSRAG